MIKNLLPSEIAEFLHSAYERQAKLCHWETQKGCQVPFEELPYENKRVMLRVACDLIDWLQGKAVNPTPMVKFKELERLRKWAEGARDYIEAMRNVQGTPAFIQSQKPPFLDLSVENELLSEYDKIEVTRENT